METPEDSLLNGQYEEAEHRRYMDEIRALEDHYPSSPILKMPLPYASTFNYALTSSLQKKHKWKNY